MELNKKLNIKFLREIKFLYIIFLAVVAITLIFLKQYIYTIILFIIIGVFILILEAFEKGIRILQLKSKGAEVKIEMAEAKEKIEQKAESLTNSLEYKVNISKKILDKDEMKELIQKSLDEAFVLGLKIGGYKKPFSEINNFRIFKNKSGHENVQWNEVW